MLRILTLLGSILYLLFSCTTVYGATVESKFTHFYGLSQNNTLVIDTFPDYTASPSYTESFSPLMNDKEAGIILIVLITAFFFLSLLFGFFFGFLLVNYNKNNKTAKRKYHNYYTYAQKSYYREQRRKNQQPLNWNFDNEENPDIIKYKNTQEL